MTFRTKVIVWYSGLLAAVLLVFGIALVSVTRWMVIHAMDNMLAQTSEQLIAASTAYAIGEFGPPESLVLRLPEGEILAPGVAMQVWDVNDLSNPRLVSQSSALTGYSDPLDAVSLTQEAHLLTSTSNPTEPLISETRVKDEPWRVQTTMLPVYGRMYVLQTGTSMEMINGASQGLLAIIGIELAIALIGSLALGWALTNRLLHRIDVITEAAGRVSASEDLKTRLPYDGPMDEIGRLTAVFNQMMCRLEHLFSVQQRFVGDVSHELRTPLTAIRGHLDLIHRYGMDADSMEAIESEVDRMSRMVTDLLLLAKADYGGLTLNMRVVDLDELVSEVYRSARGLVKERNLQITIHEYEPVRVMGDPDRLTQLLLNLVSNAIKFTPDGGAITINLRHTSTEAVLEVSDTGIGICEEDQRRVFDRFFQVDSSRVRGEGIGRGDGVGLGLSIAKWIAEAHHGHIAVQSTVGVGTTFSVFLPLLEPARDTQQDTVPRSRLGLIRRDRTGQYASPAVHAPKPQ
ncbi:MAG: HAMP domain-containing sensor histidine kinase [Anaerolineae bacterium]